MNSGRPRPWMVPALAALAGCGNLTLAGPRPSAAEARAYHYQDSSGLLVGTYGASVRQPLPAGLVVDGKALADYVQIDPGRGFDPAEPSADRRAPDAITSASATVAGGEGASEWRFEGQVGLDAEGAVKGAPVTAGLVARASTEPDYESLSVAARGGAELAERNTSIAALVGHGRDRIDPLEVAGGDEARWPASHQRWAATVLVSQLVSERIVASAGASGTWQRGTLSSPYRRALVAPSLLVPERLPRARDRYTAFVGAALSLSPRLALHLRQGAYADSWSVRALIPELIVAGEVHDGVLLQAGYRHYAQSAASFYEPTYAEPRPVMTGDLRLGPIRDHAFSVDLRRRAGAFGGVLAGYQLSVLDYRGVGSRVVAHVFMLGVAAGY